MAPPAQAVSAAPGYEAFRATHDLDVHSLCRRIVAAHRDSVRVKGDDKAVANMVRIMEAALRLGNRGGYHALNLRDLAAEAQMSLGSLYSYFESKEALLQRVLWVVSQTVREVLTAPPDGLENACQRLEWLIATHIHLTEAMLAWFRFAYMEARAFPDAAREFARESELFTESLVSAVLSAGIEDGVFRRLDTRMAAALVKPLLQDWYLKRGKYRRRGLGPDDYAAEVTAFVMRAVAPG